MPKSPINYNRTTIYKIIKNDDFENANVYVGSTTDFTKRKYLHKYNCCNETKLSHLKVYDYIRQNGGWKEWNMVEIERYPCTDRRQAEAREEYWRCYLKAELNSKKAFITEDELKDYQKEYRKSNAEYIREYSKKHYQANPEYFREYRKANLENIKEYQSQYQLTYQPKYRDEHADIMKKKHQCECSGKYTGQNKATHAKSKRHIQYLSTIQNKIEMI